MIRRYAYDTALGWLEILAEQDAVIGLAFGRREEVVPVCQTDLIRETATQLFAYLAGARTAFTVPLRPAGTAFQQRVWGALCEIPYGQTRSYAQIAQAVDSPNACRAVGMANHRNPIPILIPCHRVIGANGDLVGYGGGLAIKERLLLLERQGIGAKTWDMPNGKRFDQRN
ncbi:MAG: methylated-DNA--[protein]-cysteine S-methyltransferase [Clostridia bacterium]